MDLHYNMYCSGNVGLCNVLMSFECGALISYLTNRELVLYNPSPIDAHVYKNPELKNRQKPFYLYNLFDIKLPFIHVKNENIPQKFSPIPDFDNCAYYIDDIPSPDFLNHREKAFDLKSIESCESIRTTGKKSTLSYYSHLFYSPTRREELINFIKTTIKPKQKYLDLTDEILKKNNLTNFNCIAVRRNDFCYIKSPLFNNKDITSERFLSVLLNNFDPSVPLLITTDEKDYNYFKPIHDHFKTVLYTYDLFDAYDIFELEKGLLKMLVSSRSNDFIGTLGSTYSGFIQRYRIQNGLSKEFKFLYSLTHQYVLEPDGQCKIFNDKTYTWGRVQSTDSNLGITRWYREWPESIA